MNIVKIKCRICGNIRKAIKNTPREIERICGNCWDWEKYPNPMATPQYVDREKYRPVYSDSKLKKATGAKLSLGINKGEETTP